MPEVSFSLTGWLRNKLLHANHIGYTERAIFYSLILVLVS